ncbi:MAG TPA: ABC-F family ATP-binding cassette domain-containing protein [Clostridiales bacterium]|nr:ABC-F family ATP-binding cassette domain-containing protein [Clostridiales bacterium]HOL91451.1 ABC-F family ATP-binding cassette domain-containing protein [Clostridiales bacterium]HPP35446.1 ABC-F family ATP-binding cassette domain-containing protein [Clostridiales bacterium]
MIILSCNNISFSYGTDIILNSVSLRLQQGEKAGLVGVNGAGKSTLFKIITGQLKQDSGEIFISKDLRIGYLEQSSGLESDNTIWDEMLVTFSPLIKMENRIRQLATEMAGEKDESSLNSMMKEYDGLLERFSREGGYEYNSRIRGVLKGLGFEESQFGLHIRALSGGQKTRLALARLLLEEPDLLLLDEPTNHLDISAIEWLEDFLKNYRKSLIVISHDRYFLDTVTMKTFELENNKCTTYEKNYTGYAEQKARDREIQQKHYEQQQKEIARLEAFIEKQRQWNRQRNIIAAESRQKAIDRMEKTEAPDRLPDSINIRLQSSRASGNDVLSVKDLSKSFPGKQLFSGINFEVKKSERLFIVGPNGCGKSTLLKILAGKLHQDSGGFKYGHNVILGYYDQELEGLDDNNTVLEEVWNGNDWLTHTQIRNVLAQFLFTGEDVCKNIGVLSGGEKSRVALAKLMLSGANLLLLDEPTNHLDINSREALEEALLSYDGTIIAVSHDRYFMRKLATRVVEMANGGIADYKGGYAFYLEHRRDPEADRAAGRDRAVTASKLEHLESKEDRARKRKLKKMLAECESEINRAEARLAAISVEMSREDALSDHILLTALHDEQTELENRLEELYRQWADLAEQCGDDD